MAAAALLLAVPASAQVRGAETFGPRPFGVLLGDVFTLKTYVDVDAGFRLDPSSLPKVGPVSYSLDLRRIDVTDGPAPNGGVRYQITAEYQTFYSALETKEEKVPPFTLAFADGAGKRAEVQAGRWSYLTSPLRPIASVSGEQQYGLRPDAAPHSISLRRAEILTGLAGGATLLALALLAWSRAWPPFHRRPARPFAAAARAVRKAAGAGETGWRAAALALHRAFDAAAGKRLFGDDVAAFIKTRPAFARHEAAIAAFFDASRRAFFGEGTNAAAALPPEQLTRLARDLASAERAT
ncbi:mxaA protein [Methylopila capsulata]|uniref:MxaA protein n=1 Tax=Methylopila capsulata TaxID=61654 RepID=A0A9W6ISQ8_9HYPH|nr:hypothetical protein [Methylopila capsulata]MBM7851562.1 mxaA protein [Methylopila capsulata]GLK54620.1 hypothetical protein GCM10008170_06390 [Methylopila capsulata]